MSADPKGRSKLKDNDDHLLQVNLLTSLFNSLTERVVLALANTGLANNVKRRTYIHTIARIIEELGSDSVHPIANTPKKQETWSRGASGRYE